jgi:hypothetical protein
LDKLGPNFGQSLNQTLGQSFDKLGPNFGSKLGPRVGPKLGQAWTSL